MWHQLVLHGIGGKTIAEAKENMSYGEYLDWCEYIRRRGSLDVGSRLEWAAAMISMIVNNSNGGKAKMTDFMPHWEQPQAKVEDVFRMLKSKVRKK